jgi:thiosulfate/3-mercaptopyruvate sulfurtransferase
MDSLVSTEWLAAELDAPDLKLVDATSFLPTEGRDARAEYEQEHLPGAVFMDLHEIVDTDNPVPAMLPPDFKFASRMQALGIGNGDRIIVYDNSPSHSAARAWWMLKSFGARDIAILDGGLPKWKAEGRPLEGGVPNVQRGHFTAALDPSQLADKLFVDAVVRSGDHELVDARPLARFSGEEPDPRPGLAAGHIPGSRNLPQGRLFNPDNSWKRGDALRAAFEEARM